MKVRNFLYLFLLINIVFCQRQVSPESKVFTKTKPAVCTVFGKSGHGSGFLYNKNGLIITNDHVLGDNPGKYLSVQFNENEKYFAEVVSRDKYKDVAIIGVNPSVIKNIKPLNYIIHFLVPDKFCQCFESWNRLILQPNICWIPLICVKFTSMVF